MEYSVYTLTDGMIGDTDMTVDSFDDAYALYEATIGCEILMRNKLGAEYTETTIHLYDPVLGNMIAEECVTIEL